MSEFESWIDDRRPRFASKHKDNGGEAEFMASRPMTIISNVSLLHSIVILFP